MNYYQMLKEEKAITIMKIAGNHTEVLAKLDEIESNVGIENILPFYDELIDLALMGSVIDVHDLGGLYKLYCKTHLHAWTKLSDAYKCLKTEMNPSIEELNNLLPWHSKLRTKIKKLLSTNKK